MWLGVVLRHPIVEEKQRELYSNSAAAAVSPAGSDVSRSTSPGDSDARLLTAVSMAVVSSPFIDVGRPSVDVSRPHADVSRPSIDVVRPTVSIGVDVSRPHTDVSRPTLDVSRLHTDVSRPSISVGRPSVDVCRPHTDVSSPFIDVGRPHADVSRPSVNIGRPTVSIGVDDSRPHTDVSSPFIDVGRPFIDVSRPHADVSRPVDVGRPTVCIGVDVGRPHTTVGVSADSLSGRPFVAVTSRTPRTAAIANSRPVSVPTRQFITAPPPPLTPSPVSASSAPGPSLPQSVPSVAAVAATLRVPSGTAAPSLCPPAPGEFQVAVATALPCAQPGFATSPDGCQVADCRAATPPTTVGRSTSTAVHLQQVYSCEVAWPTAQQATVPSTRHPAHLDMDVVALPTRRAGDTDSLVTTRHTADTFSDRSVTYQHAADTVSDIGVTLTPPRHSFDGITDSSVTLTQTLQLARDTAADNATSASAGDSVVSLTAPASWCQRAVVGVSPLSSASSSPSCDTPTLLPPELPPEIPLPLPEIAPRTLREVAPPTLSQEIPATVPLEMPVPPLPERQSSSMAPPPYPGRAPVVSHLSSSALHRRLPPPPPPDVSDQQVLQAADTMRHMEVSVSHSADSISPTLQRHLAPAADSLVPQRRLPPPPPDSVVKEQVLQAADSVSPTLESVAAVGESTDEDVVVMTECQRIESPKPVRRASQDQETKVRTTACWYVGQRP